jgi:flagellar basal-body rod modification protein FlgD
MSTIAPASTSTVTATNVLDDLRRERPVEEGPSAGRQLTTDFQTFLTLLTTQLQNQDPLKPLESAEFVAQLAQFSSVEQQIATNTSLGRILEAINGAGSGSLGDWLGRDVRAAVPIDHQGGPVEVFAPEPPAGALSAALVVRNQAGLEVRRIPMELRDRSAVWDGTRANGEPAPPGSYRFEIAYALPQNTVETKGGEVFARVLEARRTDDGIELALAGGGVARAADVTAVRAPAVTGPGG